MVLLVLAISLQGWRAWLGYYKFGLWKRYVTCGGSDPVKKLQVLTICLRRRATGTRCSIILGSVDVFLWLALCYIFWMDLVIVQLKGNTSGSPLEFCDYTLCRIVSLMPHACTWNVYSSGIHSMAVN